ncbi:MAG TPA: hypothetical protein DFR83_14320 [Deltaproteobacteria bacterium]|nr:hypothetical protein [Deltaproteobacteria bacterium]
MAWATDVDAWSPGPASGELSDPLSGLTARAPLPGTTMVGTWFQLGLQPLYGLTPSTQQGTWSPALAQLGTAGLWGDWRPDARLPLTFGGRARFRSLVVPTNEVASLDPSAGWTDGTAWVRWHSRTSGDLGWSATIEGSVDPDTLIGSPSSGDLGWITGSGNSIGSSVAVQQSVADVLVTSLALHYAYDLRAPESLPKLDQYPARQLADVRAGVAFPRPRFALLAEIHTRGAHTAPPSNPSYWSQATELRGGVRTRLGARWQATTTVGMGLPFYDRGSRVQPNGAPRARIGLDLRRVRAPEGITADQPLAPGELVVAPVDATGTAILRVQTPGHAHRVGPNGEHIIRPETNVPIVVEADGRIRLTATPPTDVQVWRPVLPLRAGAARLDIVLEDTAARSVVARALTVGGVSVSPGTTGTTVTLEGLAEGPVPVTAGGPLFLLVNDALTAGADTAPDRLVVERPAGATRVQVTADGQPIANAPLAAWDGLERQTTTTDAEGFGFFVLPVGLWKIRVDVEGKGSQEQSVDVTADPHHLQEVPFRLLPRTDVQSTNLDVMVFDPSGARVDRATVVLGDEAIGETASGGHLRIEQLPVTEEPISIRGNLLESTPELRVPWSIDDDTRLGIPVNWQPGVARIRVRDSENQAIPDTQVRIIPTSGAGGDPILLGRSGALETVLEPGAYEVLVMAPDYGLQLYDLVVPAEPGQRVLLDIQLQPAGGVGTQLTLRIVDENNRPVERAHIMVDGELLAAPAHKGQWSIEALPTGVHAVEVVSEIHQTWTGTVTLETEQHLEETVVMDTLSGILDTVAVYEGVPVPGTVRMVGPENRPPIPLGADGKHRFHLSKGAWEAVFAAPGFGIDALDTTVFEDEQVELVWSPDLLEPSYATIALPPRPVTVRVLDRATGEALPATIRALGSDVVAPEQATADTPAALKLVPGTWELLAEVDGRGVTGGRFLVSALKPTTAIDLIVRAPRVTVSSAEVRLDERILFAVGESTIEPVSMSLLDELARTLLVHPELRRVAVEGHTDDSGSDDRNLRLSRQRADAVKRALVSRGVAPGRLVVEAYGASRPVGDNMTEAGRELNRRVVVRIVERTDPR